MRGKLRHTENRAKKWLELTEKAFNFVTYARETFLKASKMGKAGLELKKDILMSLGYNPEIKAGKLYLEIMPYYAPIKNETPALQVKYERLELLKKTDNKAYLDALAPIRAQWRRWWDSNPRSREAHAFQACAIDHYATPP